MESTDPAVYLESELDATADRVERRFAPLVEVGTEGQKHLMTISGGALISSVTLVQFFADRVHAVDHAWLLYASWILFIATIWSSLLVMERLGDIRLYRLLLHIKRNEVETEVQVVTPANVNEVRQEIVNRAEAALAKSLRLFTPLRYIAGIGFLAALFSLVTFTILNSPF